MMRARHFDDASHFDGDDATMTQPQSQAARAVRFTDGSVQKFVKISQDALPWRLTGSTLNGHNLRQESLVVFLRDNARNHAPSPEVVIYSLVAGPPEPRQGRQSQTL